MFVIGLTGNIGSGKSTVARYLKDLGAIVIDADQVAREVVQPGTPAIAEIVNSFGPDILNSEGALDRKKMGSIAFSNPQAMARLNEITHPRIVETINQKKQNLQLLPDSHNMLLVIDAPLLIEVGLHKEVDEIWVVKVDESKQVERLSKRDGLSNEEVRMRIAAQMPQEEKLKYAQRVIDNSGSPEETREQVIRYWSNLQKEHFQKKELI